MNGNMNVLKFSGSGIAGNNIGDAITSEYNDLWFGVTDQTGNIYVVDAKESGANRLLRIDGNGNSSILIDFVNGWNIPSIIAVTTNKSGHLYVSESFYYIYEYSSSSSSSTSSNSSSSSSYDDFNEIFENGDNEIFEDGTNELFE